MTKITQYAIIGFAFFSLSSCTFHNTMKQRRAENIMLREQHAAETARTEELKRKN